MGQIGTKGPLWSTFTKLSSGQEKQPKRAAFGQDFVGHSWETGFNTPPVLGGAALRSAPAVYKNPAP